MNSTDKPRRSRDPRKAPRPQRDERSAPAARPYVMAAVRIEQVRSVLGEILQWEYPADAALSHWLRANPKLGMRDRAEVAEAVFDVLRHLRRYRQYAESGTGPAARRLPILGLASVFDRSVLDTGLSEPERHWLTHVQGIYVDSLS